MSKRKFFKRKCEYWLIKVIEGLARATPRRVGHWLFSSLGGVVGRLFREDRKRALDNLAIAFEANGTPLSVRILLGRPYRLKSFVKWLFEFSSEIASCTSQPNK